MINNIIIGLAVFIGLKFIFDGVSKIFESKNTFSDGTVEAWYNPQLDLIHLYSIDSGVLYLATGGSVTVSRKAVESNCKYLGEL